MDRGWNFYDPSSYGYYSMRPYNGPYFRSMTMGSTLPYWEGPWAGGRFYDYDLDYFLEDDEMADLVRDNIDFDPYIPRSDKNKIEIKVKDGIVTLSGEVRNKRSKYLSFTDAFLCDAVVDVKSNVKIKERKKKKREKK